MKAETRVIHLTLQMAPLADWMRRFKPTCSRMSIRRRDYKFLLDHPEIATRYGISVDAKKGKIIYQGFEIYSTDCGGVSTDPEEALHG
jgi:hypothetical protein